MILDAIQWRWPGAKCVVREGVVVRWDGPMARPSDAEIAQAVADYQAGSVAKDAQAARLSEDLLVRALARAVWEELQKCQPRTGQTLLDLQGFRDRVKALVRNLLT